LAERHAEESEYADRREERHKPGHARNLVLLVFVCRIDEHETCHSVNMFRCKHTHRETAYGCADKNHRSADAAAV
jgi:hypothetical protein